MVDNFLRCLVKVIMFEGVLVVVDRHLTDVISQRFEVELQTNHVIAQEEAPLEEVVHWESAVAGAELNVAIGLALIAVNHLIINLGERGIVHYGDKLSNIMVNHASYYLPEGNHFRQAQTKLVPQGGSHV